MPRKQARCHSVPQPVLLSSGVVSTVMLDRRYTPYERQGARIENLCGYFAERADPAGVEGLVVDTLSCMGRQRELYHVQGNVTLHRVRTAFMAARGMAGLEALAGALGLDAPTGFVHMAILCGKLGKRVQVSRGGLLETNVDRWAYHVRVHCGLYEQTNSMRFSIHRFQQQFELPAAYIPDDNDWTVTGRGTVIVRLTWKQMPWDHAVERACVDMCDRVLRWLDTCC